MKKRRFNNCWFILVLIFVLFSCDNPLVGVTSSLETPVLRGKTPTNVQSPFWFWSISSEAESFSYRFLQEEGEEESEWISLSLVDGQSVQFKNWQAYYDSDSPGEISYITDQGFYVYTWQGELPDRTEKLFYVKANYLNKKSEIESSAVVQKTIEIDLDPPGSANFDGDMVGLTSAERPVWQWHSSNETSYYLVSFDEAASFRIDYTISDQDDLPEGEFTPESDLSEGYHNLTVWVYDEAGNASVPVSYIIHVDRNTDMVPKFIDIHNPTPERQPLISWTEPTGATKYRYQFQVGGTELNLDGWTETTETSYRIDPPQNDGDYVFYLQAYGTLSGVTQWFNVTSLEFTIDSAVLLPPEVSVGDFDTPVLISSDLTPTWIWRVSQDGTTYIEPEAYRYQLNTEYENAWVEVAGTVEEFTPPSNLFIGNSVLYVQAKNDKGVWSSSGSFKIELETTSPSIQSFSPTNDDTPVDYDQVFTVNFSESIVDFTLDPEYTEILVQYASSPSFPSDSTTSILTSDLDCYWEEDSDNMVLKINPPSGTSSPQGPLAYPSWPQGQWVRITINPTITDEAGNGLSPNTLIIKDFLCVLELPLTGLPTSILNKINPKEPEDSAIYYNYAHEVQYLKYNPSLEADKLTNLTGFEYLTNLQYLNLTGNSIEDLSGLEKLTKLTTLFLNDNSISADPSATLHPLTELTYLNLSNNSLVTLSDLSTSPLLSDLICNDNELTAIPDLTGLDQVTYINFSNNKIDSSAVALGEKLSNHEELVNLNLSNNELTEVPILENLPKLEKLCLNNNDIDVCASITNLSSLTAIKELNLFSQTPESSPIGTFPDLTSLSSSLEILNLEDTGLTDWDNISTLSSLIELYISQNAVTPVPDLSPLANLEILEINNSGLTGWDNISTVPSLRELYISQNAVTSVPDLTPLVNLKILDISNSGLTDWDNISTVPSLEELYISQNSLTSVPDLSSMINLDIIEAKETNLTDVSNFSTATNLEELWLNSANNSLLNIVDLGTLTHLVLVAFSDCLFLTDVDFDDLEAALQTNTTTGLTGAQIVYRDDEAVE